MSIVRRRIHACLTVVLLVGCRGALYQSALEPKGPQAMREARLWWFAFWIAAVVYVLTMIALMWAVWRGRQRVRRGEAPPIDAEPRMSRGVTGAVAATVVILLVFLGYDLSVGRAMTGAPNANMLTVEIVGHQWWWEVTYSDPSPTGRFTTANEIHVPVGTPVLFVLNSADVIHSFWVPNLAGKKDLVPGRTQSWWFQADSAGVYRGQCAEFCGYQHAKMALQVIAESPAQYAQWARASQAQATPPTDPVAMRGQRVFMQGTCVMCHSIKGTPAGSHAGPDLTHLASRRTLAAGTIRNTRGNLAGWIVDPQRIKPGANMPPNQLAPSDLDALVTYLQTLR